MIELGKVTQVKRKHVIWVSHAPISRSGDPASQILLGPYVRQNGLT